MNYDYANSHHYESLIRLAFNCSREEQSAHNANMLNLIWKEKDNLAVAHLKKENLLHTVQEAMNKAFYEIYKRPLSEEDRLKLATDHAHIGQCNNSDELLELCITGRDLLLKYQ